MLYQKKKWMVIIFILPFLVLAGIFLIYPFISNCVNAFFLFQSRSQSLSEATFAGWTNFVNLFNDGGFGYSIGNTFILIAFVIVFQMGIALILALMVDRIKKFAGFFRVVYFIPIVLSGSLIGSMFLMFQDADFGLFNQILHSFGVTEKVFFVNANNWFGTLLYLMVPIIWQYVGFYFVILLTGLSNISDDIMEAAALDGASTMQQIRYVTIPMLQNVFRTCMVLSITGALKVFDVPFVMAGGAGNPAYFMGTYNQYLFDNYANMNNPGYTRVGESAIYSVILVLVGIFVSQVSNLVLRENKDI